MQFIVIAYDGEDADAINRRMKARQSHIAKGDELKARGVLMYAIALLDDDERMIGSVMAFELDSREELDSILSEEPYITGEVWDKIEVKRCKVGPSFV